MRFVDGKEQFEVSPAPLADRGRVMPTTGRGADGVIDERTTAQSSELSINRSPKLRKSSGATDVSSSILDWSHLTTPTD